MPRRNPQSAVVPNWQAAGNDWMRADWLRSIIALSTDFFWETDAAHRFTILAEGGKVDPFRFSPLRLGKARWEIPSVLPDAEGWRAHRETLQAHRAFRDFEIARVDDSGVLRHFVVDGEPFFDVQGNFLGYRGVGREITARKHVERLLQESNRQFRAFLDSMPAIAWIKDSRLRYTWISASYTRVYGKSIDDIQGKEDFEVWPGELARQFRGDDEKVLRANGPVQSVYDVPLRDGLIARWLVIKFPVPDGAGAPGVAGIGFEFSAHDRGEALPPGVDAAKPLERLSARERQVLQMIVDGCTSAEAGKRLGLSSKSVDTYRSRVMAKLDVEDLPTLVKFAIRHGITTAR